MQSRFERKAFIWVQWAFDPQTAFGQHGFVYVHDANLWALETQKPCDFKTDQFVGQNPVSLRILLKLHQGHADIAHFEQLRQGHATRNAFDERVSGWIRHVALF